MADQEADGLGRPEYDPRDPEYLEWAARSLEDWGSLPIYAPDLVRIIRTHAAALRVEWRLRKAERELKRVERRLEELREIWRRSAGE